MCFHVSCLARHAVPAVQVEVLCLCVGGFSAAEEEESVPSQIEKDGVEPKEEAGELSQPALADEILSPPSFEDDSCQHLSRQSTAHMRT